MIPFIGVAKIFPLMPILKNLMRKKRKKEITWLIMLFYAYNCFMTLNLIFPFLYEKIPLAPYIIIDIEHMTLFEKTNSKGIAKFFKNMLTSMVKNEI
jgi:hypothetical protein